eukprot:4859755-Amphidinium_carterae.1
MAEICNMIAKDSRQTKCEPAITTEAMPDDQALTSSNSTCVSPTRLDFLTAILLLGHYVTYDLPHFRSTPAQ